MYVDESSYATAYEHWRLFNQTFETTYSLERDGISQKLLNIIKNKPKELQSAFSWGETSQGFEFWARESRQLHLSPKALAILESLCINLDSEVKEIDWL